MCFSPPLFPPPLSLSAPSPHHSSYLFVHTTPTLFTMNSSWLTPTGRYLFRNSQNPGGKKKLSIESDRRKVRSPSRSRNLLIAFLERFSKLAVYLLVFLLDLVLLAYWKNLVLPASPILLGCFLKLNPGLPTLNCGRRRRFPYINKDQARWMTGQGRRRKGENKVPKRKERKGVSPAPRPPSHSLARLCLPSMGFSGIEKEKGERERRERRRAMETER